MSIIKFSQNRKILQEIAEEKEMCIQNATQKYRETINAIKEISLFQGVSEDFLRREIENQYDAEIANIHQFYTEKIEKLL